MSGAVGPDRRRLLVDRGFALLLLTLAWDAVGVVVLVLAVLDTRSVALAAFGLQTLVALGASTVVVWELSGVDPGRRRRALRRVGVAFLVLAGYLVAQSAVALVDGHRPVHGVLGAGWVGVTALVMAVLAALKERTGRELADPVLVSEGRVTSADAALASVVVLAVVLDGGLGWWWADASVGFVVAGLAVQEARHCLRG